MRVFAADRERADIKIRPEHDRKVMYVHYYT